jgi:hypothetical protein
MKRAKSSSLSIGEAVSIPNCGYASREQASLGQVKHKGNSLFQ